MKALIPLLFVLSSAFANDPTSYLNNFDSRVYSLKTKGVKDFVVDIENPKLTKQLNDQQLFGKVEEVVFRTYWTANPERLAIEVIGLPDGFKEVKEELKASILPFVDNLLPQATVKRFTSYKLSPGNNPKEFIAKDATGIAPVPSFTLKFDEQDKLSDIIGHRPVGTLVIKPDYQKETFSDGKWVLKEQVTTTTENGQVLTIKKELEYGSSQGLGIVKEVQITTEQKATSGKPVTVIEKIVFKNYKINEGEGLKYFLSGTDEVPPQPSVKK